MAVKHYLKPGLTDRSRVKILTVDTTTRRVEAAFKDGSMVHVAVWDTPHAFRWPKENEIWVIRRDNGTWMLDRKQDGQVSGSGITTTLAPEPHPVEAMQPGEMKLDAEIVVNDQGYTLIAVDLTGIQNGWTLKWNATLGRFVAGP